MDDSVLNRMFGMSGPILLVVSGIIMLTFGTQFVRSELQGNIVVISGVMLVVLGGAVSALTYLRGHKEKTDYVNGDNYVNITNTIEDNDIDRIVELLSEKIQERDSALESTKSFELTEDERAQVIQSIKSTMSKELADNLFKSAKSALSNNVAENKYFLEFRKELQKTKVRLTNEISALTRRGNLNLVIGGVTTILAVSLLGYVVLTAKSNALELKDFIWHYIPRITVSVFIQIFSFFFLRLYRNSLDDIKYFQNELTNVDSRFASLEAALILGDKEVISNVINEVANTDRNSKLKKGESTVALEKLREENKSLGEMLGSAKDLISSIKK